MHTGREQFFLPISDACFLGVSLSPFVEGVIKTGQ